LPHPAANAAAVHLNVDIPAPCLADDLQEFPDEERRDVTRALFDQLLWPAITVAGDVHAANAPLGSFTAVVHGFAYLPRSGFTCGFPTDMRGFPTEDDLVANEAARAVRTLARAAAGLL
jgi:hypothetical protein